MFSANQNAEIVAYMLITIKKLTEKTSARRASTQCKYFNIYFISRKDIGKSKRILWNIDFLFVQKRVVMLDLILLTSYLDLICDSRRSVYDFSSSVKQQ